MHVFTIANLRGGEGKTITALVLANFLRELEYRVLFIDLDSQCNATDKFNIETNNINTVYDVLKYREMPIENAIQHGKFGDIIAGDCKLGAFNIYFEPIDYRYVNHLSKALKTISDKYDFVVIDTSPIDTFSIYVGLTAANSVIIPASFGMHWAYILKEISNLILDTKDVFNPQLEVDGILITKYDEDYSEMQEVEKQYFEIASKYDIDIFKTRIHNFLNLRQDFRQVFKYDYVNFCMELLEKHNWFTGEN